MGISEWVGIISLIISLLTGPLIALALSAIHETRTNALIDKALDKKTTSDGTANREAATKLIEDALEKERERAKDIFALKHEMSEVKGQVTEIKAHVMQLLTVTSATDDKIDRVRELLVELRTTR